MPSPSEADVVRNEELELARSVKRELNPNVQVFATWTPEKRSHVDAPVDWPMPASKRTRCFANVSRSQKIRMRLGGSPDPFGPIPERPRAAP